jgi:hypothetical protein
MANDYLEELRDKLLSSPLTETFRLEIGFTARRNLYIDFPEMPIGNLKVKNMTAYVRKPYPGESPAIGIRQRHTNLMDVRHPHVSSQGTYCGVFSLARRLLTGGNVEGFLLELVNVITSINVTSTYRHHDGEMFLCQVCGEPAIPVQPCFRETERHLSVYGSPVARCPEHSGRCVYCGMVYTSGSIHPSGRCPRCKTDWLGDTDLMKAQKEIKKLVSPEEYVPPLLAEDPFGEEEYDEEDEDDDF